MIDFHTHILPAIDDGAVTVDESIAMAKALAAFGYKTVCCTPHCIKGYYDLTPHKVREATLMLQADLDNADVKLDLWSGMEYMLDECFVDFADDLLPLGETNLVLCEAPPQAHPGFVRDGLELIISKGFTPLVAHPERTQFFYEELTQWVAGSELHEKTNKQTDADMEGFGTPPTTQRAPRGFLKRLFSPLITRHPPRATHSAPPATRHSLPEGCLFHANLGSFTGFYGAQVQRKAYDLLKLGVYTAMASDLHDSRSAQQVLVYDKFAMNPILKKLADFDGVAPAVQAGSKQKEGKQGNLFNLQG